VDGGRIEGRGVFYDGWLWEGYFKDNMRHGHSRYIDIDGSSMVGKMEKGSFVDYTSYDKAGKMTGNLKQPE